MSDTMQVSRNGFTLVPAADRRRFVLQARPGTLDAAVRALGLAETPAMLAAATGGAVTALRLGPQEFLLLLDPAGAEDSLSALRAGLEGVAHSLVEVSDRQVGLDLSGALVEPALASLTSIDVAGPAFPVGMATRTLLGKADGVLWRTGPDRFRLEIWRSFAPYMSGLLNEAARDAVF
ncbi:sarcosine oxidase gamma subunit [Gluconacetobacter azotocaptans]|uniref:Sarcosine oxidase gamma subunit n=2 Tax=Gluconacetobacter azotocaptans TaxID=142834 RepID=A0A7W4JU20_9PROT|nr:sarcosine oxidase subunit gamma family protein [Gluconacetobacter azotocaptans]MBB2190837.1 sarcosine oxidase gamma subunit [Gluconacetobacter azotocaptans]MBM9400718.1 sarcosine oxidase gamma subunit [Gluconacetobacter azotocaptans]